MRRFRFSLVYSNILALYVISDNVYLTERFAVDAIRVHDLWHFQHRLIRKILSHTVMVFLNLQLKRDPLDLDGLVSA